MRKAVVVSCGSAAVLTIMFAGCGGVAPPAHPQENGRAPLVTQPIPESAPRKNGPIIISANTGSGWQVYRIDPDGRHLKAITKMPATTYDAWFPIVSRDGKRIAFTYGTAASSYGFSTDVYVVNVDGSGLKRVTHDGLSAFASWSPDGRRLVYATISPKTQRFYYLVTAPLSDPDKRTALTDDVFFNFNGIYTPDGSRIVFNTEDGGVVSSVWIMNVDGTQKRALSDAASGLCPFDVSNDGKRVLVQSKCDYFAPLRRWIGVMTIDDGHVTRLTEPPPGLFYDLTPSWSPDEKQIAFSSNRLTPDGLDLFVMNADGTGNIHRIATGLTVGGCPDDNCVTPSWASR